MSNLQFYTNPDSNKLLRWIDSKRIPVREKFNGILGRVRVKKILDPDFTIISNNCWAGHVYRYFNLPYNSPTVGLYFFGDDYVRFVSNLKYYCEMDLEMINVEESHNYEKLLQQGNTFAPIGRLDDVEIVFLHSHSKEEAIEKWKRRCHRIFWNNIIIKFSEQNYATFENLRDVDNLPYKKKLIFTTRDYGLKSQVLFREYEGYAQIPDEITHFRRYVDLINFINGDDFIL